MKREFAEEYADLSWTFNIYLMPTVLICILIWRELCLQLEIWTWVYIIISIGHLPSGAVALQYQHKASK